MGSRLRGNDVVAAVRGGRTRVRVRRPTIGTGRPDGSQGISALLLLNPRGREKDVVILAHARTQGLSQRQQRMPAYVERTCHKPENEMEASSARGDSRLQPPLTSRIPFAVQPTFPLLFNAARGGHVVLRGWVGWAGMDPRVRGDDAWRRHSLHDATASCR